MPAPANTVPAEADAGRPTRSGLAYALAAYLWWGLAPAYFKAVAHVPAIVVMGHRIVWSVVVLALVITAAGQWPQVADVARRRSLWPWLAASTSLVTLNWFVFIYAIETERLVEASMGYFMSPLVMVVLGMVFLGERLRGAQWAAGAIAGAGVGYLAWAGAGLPWISIVLPVSFGLYGLIRKQAPVGPVVGLFVETIATLPLAVPYLAWVHAQPEAAAFNDPATLGLLSLAGIVTAAPMLWYVAGARRLRLVTMGFLQYLSPTMQLLIAVLAFGEPFSRERQVAFVCIWVALVVFVADSILQMRRERAARGLR